MELLALDLKLVTFSSACKKYDDDEALPNFIKRKHPRKGEKRKEGARIKVQASKQPKRGGSHTKVMEPLSIETFTSHMKHIN
jgi:hypothetical protein